MENSRVDNNEQALTTLTNRILNFLNEIKKQLDFDKDKNAENGYWEFAYAEYYLAEVSNLLNLSMYLLKKELFQKYIDFPIRLIMEIVLQMEHIYSTKNNKGLDSVRRLFFKDMAISAKSTLSWPGGDEGKQKITNQLNLLNIGAKILKLDFNTDDVSKKSKRDIKPLCDKSQITVKKITGSELYCFYELLSGSHHSNVVNIGASNKYSDKKESLGIFEIGIELAIRFCEMIVKESQYSHLNTELNNLKQIAGV